MRRYSNKCKDMHFGNKNLRSEYSIDNLFSEQRIELDESECKRDMGVFVSSDLKLKKNEVNIVSIANKVLGTLVKNFNCSDREKFFYKFQQASTSTLIFEGSCT